MVAEVAAGSSHSGTVAHTVPAIAASPITPASALD
jgi:hypothetical protein